MCYLLGAIWFLSLILNLSKTDAVELSDGSSAILKRQRFWWVGNENL